MTEAESKMILEKLGEAGGKIIASSASQEEKDAIMLILNQVLTDVGEVEIMPIV